MATSSLTTRDELDSGKEKLAAMNRSYCRLGANTSLVSEVTTCFPVHSYELMESVCLIFSSTDNIFRYCIHS